MKTNVLYAAVLAVGIMGCSQSSPTTPDRITVALAGATVCTQGGVVVVQATASWTTTDGAERYPTALFLQSTDAAVGGAWVDVQSTDGRSATGNFTVASSSGRWTITAQIDGVGVTSDDFELPAPTRSCGG